MRIVVFGDSIAYGAWDTKAGWVERLKSLAHVETIRSNGDNKNQIINLGVGGDTSKALLERIEDEIKPRISSQWPFVFVISIGTNDQRRINGYPEIDVVQYEKNMNDIMLIAKKYTDNILILGLPPLGLHEIYFKKLLYSDLDIEKYDNALRASANTNGLRYIAVRPYFDTRGIEKLFAYDYLHPNDEGHELLARIVKPILNEFGANF